MSPIQAPQKVRKRGRLGVKSAVFGVKNGQNRGFDVTYWLTVQKTMLLIYWLLQANRRAKNDFHRVGGVGGTCFCPPLFAISLSPRPGLEQVPRDQGPGGKGLHATLGFVHSFIVRAGREMICKDWPSRRARFAPSAVGQTHAFRSQWFRGLSGARILKSRKVGLCPSEFCSLPGGLGFIVSLVSKPRLGKLARRS